MSTTDEIGYCKGEVCNRDGCVGIIAEHDTDTSCSCHIHPPCSHCVDDRHYCPECGWLGIEDQKGYGDTSPQDIAYYKKQNEDFDNARNRFYEMYNGKCPIKKLEMRVEVHTHFSQKVIGVFPIGTETKESILPHVKGSFGGRFNRFGDYWFEYIAYTD